MYEIFKNETKEVVETHPGPWIRTQLRIAELNRLGLGVSARKVSGVFLATELSFKLPLNARSITTDEKNKGRLFELVAQNQGDCVYIAYTVSGSIIEVLGASHDEERLREAFPDAKIDKTIG